MEGRRGSQHRTRAIGALLAILIVAPLASCGSSSGDEATGSTTTDPAASSTTTEAGGATTGSTASPETTTAPTSTTALPDASLGQRTAPGDGTGTALLTAVRIGRNEGFERIVFEFEGDAMPGYRVQWVDGPVTADGSGEPVAVTGDALLEIVIQPASGVDLSAPELRITYDGPDRIATAGSTELLTDLVRTGDFEAVLTWVAGATEERPFRVLTLTSPTRMAIDLAT